MTPKRALGYVRISTKDQSNFSLDGQEEYIRKHCERNGWELIGISRDDGQSAKNFDRANWRELEEYIKKNHKYVDYLVVCKYDRFSRNVADALAMIEKLEKRYSIRIMSVMEPINLHPDSPYFFQFRTQMLVGAQVELMVIKDRTKFGLRQAALSGRHAHAAPFGYTNLRDDRRKPLLIVVPEQAELVREAFALFAAGVPMAEIHRKLSPRGLSIKGNSAMSRLLSNPLYAGLVKVPAYYDDPEELVPGKHEAIVDRATWWKVQAILNPRSKQRVILNDEVPLRGSLKCHCKKPLTAGNSKGKNKYYWYYKCNTHKENLNATKLHGQFDDLLREISFPDAYLRYLEAKVAEEIESMLEARTAEISARKKQLAGIEADLDRLEEKFLRDDIDKTAYDKWKVRWENERHAILQTLDDAQEPIDHVWSQYSAQLYKLQDLNFLFNKADISEKQAFIRLVFNNELYYQDGVYRTPYLLPLFQLKTATLQEKGLLIYEQPRESLREIPLVAKTGVEPVTSGL